MVDMPATVSPASASRQRCSPMPHPRGTAAGILGWLQGICPMARHRIGEAFRREDRIERMRIVATLVFAATFLLLRGVGQGAGKPVSYGLAAMEHRELFPSLLPNGT